MGDEPARNEHLLAAVGAGLVLGVLALRRRRRRRRASQDPAVALLDAWAAVAEVLSLYSDRLAEEGWLQTGGRRRRRVRCR